MKFWFDLPNNQSFYSKIKGNDIKVHYDSGVKTTQDLKKNYFYYGTVSSNRALNNVVLKAGLGHKSEHCNSDNRIRYRIAEGDWHLYHRTTVLHNKFTFGIVGVLDVFNKVLQKNNLLVGYQVNEKSNLFLRAEVNGFRRSNPDSVSSVFDMLTADYILKLNDKSKVGI